MGKIQYFETIKCLDEEVLNLEYHNNRVTRTIGLDLNLYDYIYPPSNELLKCKVIYDEDGIVDVEFNPYEKKKIESFKLVYHDLIDYYLKTVDRSNIDKLYEKKEDCDEIIIIKNGFVTDTSMANIAIEIDGFWLTPKLPLLRGTTRDRLIEDGTLKEMDIDVDMLKKANKIALMNAMVGFDIKDKFIIE